MRYLFLALLAALVIPSAGCTATVVREAKVLKTELNWFTQAAVQQADLLEHFVRTHPDCKCNEGKTAFTDPKCQKAAKTLLTAKARAPYHRDMSLYNSGLEKQRPSKTPPAIPDVATLCGEAN